MRTTEQIRPPRAPRPRVRRRGLGDILAELASDPALKTLTADELRVVALAELGHRPREVTS